MALKFRFIIFCKYVQIVLLDFLKYMSSLKEEDKNLNLQKLATQTLLRNHHFREARYLKFHIDF
jgi:hypothetical protein